MFVWSRNTVRDSSHISFFCGRDPFCEVVWQLENTHGGADRFAWLTSGPPPSLEWPVGLSFSPKLQTLYCLSSPMNTPLCPRIFLFMAGYQNLHTSSFFFSVICWSYLRTEISVILSTGNKLHSHHSSLYFSLCGRKITSTKWFSQPLCWCYLATALNLQSSSIALCR